MARTGASLMRQPASGAYRGSSFIRNSPPLGPHSRIVLKGPLVVLGGWAVSYEQGTPVRVTRQGARGHPTLSQEGVGNKWRVQGYLWNPWWS